MSRLGTRGGGVVAAAAAVTIVLLAPGTSPAGERESRALIGASDTVTLRVVVDASGHGTFMAEGAISDAGTASVRRAMARGQLTLTQTLVGTSGTLVVRALQRCGAGAASWRVLRGTAAYLGLEGGGRAAAASCSMPRRPLRMVYRGAVRLPAPAAYATPGAYGGWTAQGERITFDVLPGGRLVSNLRVEQLFARCAPSPEVVLEPAFPAAYALSADGAFATSAGDVDVTGRFGQGSAAGTIAYDAVSGMDRCSSGPVTWTARTPPDPLRTAPAGAYCGSTTQSLGACLVLRPDGRVTRLRLEVAVECTRPEQARFDAVVAFGGLVPTRSNLRFEVHAGLDDGASGDVVLRGAFDAAGTVSGTMSLHRVSVDVEGTVFFCRNAVHGWAARRLG